MDITVSGTLVSVVHTEYRSFPASDGSGAMVPAGSNDWAYLVENNESRPVAVKLTSPEEAAAFRKVFGQPITIPCTVVARDNEIILRSQGIKPTR